MTSPPRDAGIPVLTEVIESAEPPVQTVAPDTVPAAGAHAATAPVVHDDAGIVSPPAADAGVAAASSAGPASVEELEARAIASMGSEEWSRLERALRERILRQLLARVDSMLEQHVRDSLADVLQGAVSTLALDIRGGLHQSLEELIVRAVSQEIARLKTTQN